MGGLRSEVYSQFEEIFEEREITYPSSLILDEEIPVELLGFSRIEGEEKFYNVDVGGDMEVAVTVEEVLEGRYSVSRIRSFGDGNRLGNYLEDYFSVN